MKNRIASLFLVFALLMSLCNFAVARDNRITVQSGGAERFTDVPTSHWAYAYINKVVGSGLFNGKTPTTFEPSNAMTRSQFVMVMARMEGRSDLEGVETQTRFPDVTTTRRAAGPIAWATEEGFVNGFGDGTFKPDSPITRGQFAALIHRYIVAKRYVNLHPVEPEPAQFTDAASVSSAFTEDVEYARILGLLTGYSDGTVRAGNPITRAAIAAILARFLDLVTESGYTPLLDGPVIDGGDSGDSGDSGDTGGSSSGSIEYDDVKLTVSGSTHGKTTLKVTRGGKEVAADDVQAGDLVTVTHEPDSGYSVSIRVRDAKNKTVKKTTNNKTYTTTFTVPKTNLPVTVTVTYSKTSSGGGGGGGGGGGSSSGGGGGGGQTPVTQNYTLILQATVGASADNGQHGRVFLTKDKPTVDTPLPGNIQDLVQDTFTIPSVSATTAPPLTGYAVFAAEKGYELKAENITVTPADAWDKADGEVTHIHTAANNNLYYVTLTKAGVVTSANPDVTVTGMFTLIDNGSSTADKYTWTITPTVTNGFIGIYGNQADRDALTAPLEANVGLTNGSAQFAELAKDASKTVYVAVSPDALKDGTNFELTSSAGVTLSTGVDKLGNGRLYFYDLTLTGITANVTTTLSGAFKDYENGPDIGKSVTVTAKYLHVDGTELTAEELKALKPSTPEADKSPAKKDETVTVTAPVPDGFSIESVKVTGDGFDDFDATPGATSGKYTFPMPDANVTVVVTYKAQALPADEQLNFKVNVTFEGEGSIALNVAGKEYMFNSGDEATTEPTFTMFQSEYDKQYSGGIPAYLVSTIPATAKGYKFDSITAPEGFGATTAASPDRSLTDKNTTLNVTVKFVKEYSYAYNLTVIGKGSANVTLTYKDDEGNDVDKDFGSAASGSVISRSDSATLTVKATQGEGEKPVQSVLINDKTVTHNATSGASYSMQPGTAEIVVAFLPDTDTIVPFSVTLNGSGAVKIRAENGPIVDGVLPDKDTAKANLDKATKTEPSVSATTPYTGYAWLGTIITLTPELGDNVVVDSIKVDNQDRSDELSSNGFSYTLADGKDNAMVVKTSTFGGYNLLVQAPYKGALADGDMALYSFSQVDSNGKTDDPAKQATLRQILYSLNNGQESMFELNVTSDNSTENKLDHIRNHIGVTFNLVLPKVIQLYLYQPKLEQKTEAAERLEERINKGVASSITANIGNMIASKKDEMISDAKTKVDDTLKNLKLDSPDNDTLARNMKSEIVQQIMNDASTPYDVRNAYASGQITLDSFTVSLTTIPLIKTADEQNASIADKDRAAGKSVQSQITRKFLKEYLGDATHVDIVVEPSNEPASAENMGLDPKVELGSVSVGGGVVTVPISASATVEHAPTLMLNPSFTDFMTPNNELDLDVWVVATVSVSVTMPGATEPKTVLENREMFKQVTLDAAQVQTITRLLNEVDTQLSTTWDNMKNQLMSTQNGQTVLNIALGDVITKDMIEAIIKGSEDGTVEGILTPILNKLSVESLGDATATRSKVLSIYDDMVFFQPKEGSDKLDELQIKNKAGENKTLLKADGNNLTLTLDLQGFFTERGSNVDVSKESQVANADKTSFELLVDLMIGLRDAISTDIRNTNDENPQVAISKLILGQLSNNKRVVTVKKWGKTIPSTGMSASEKKEVADLLAELIMQENITETTLHNAWANFEAKGYSSIEFKSVGLPGGDLGNALTDSSLRAWNVDFNSNPTLVGVKLERTLKTPATN